MRQWAQEGERMTRRPQRRIDPGFAGDLAGLMVIIAALATTVIYAAVARFWPGVVAGYGVMVAIALHARSHASARDRRRDR
jgi:predicted ABC-type sugar transport system permease subunit